MKHETQTRHVITTQTNRVITIESDEVHLLRNALKSLINEATLHMPIGTLDQDGKVRELVEMLTEK